MPFAKVTRRQLLAGAAGTVMLAGGAGLWLVVDRPRDRRWAKPVPRDQAFAPSVYLAVDSDDIVTIWITKSEMGQGVMTALAMLIAEDLDADWAKVRVEQAVSDGRYDYGDMVTAASSSVTSLWNELRQAGAACRFGNGTTTNTSSAATMSCTASGNTSPTTRDAGPPTWRIPIASSIPRKPKSNPGSNAHEIARHVRSRAGDS
jgi:hypothetical protein